MLLDISRPVARRSEPWPGDSPFSWELSGHFARGGVNVGCITTSTHAGSHVDAPWHFLPDGATVEALPLDAFLGPARVIDARGSERRIEPSEAILRQLDGCERALFRTRERTDPYTFPAAFAGLDPGLAEELVRRRIRLFGTDAPSTDAMGMHGLPSHHVLARGSCHIVEWLDLSQAQPGDYEFIGLPLRLEGLDASPIRAVLRRKA
ncbi:MAG: cyclase family protein [Halobacteriales archaeon]|nr:cyclase family protein [Halobacteriales archaeon]